MIALGCDHGGYALMQEVIKYLDQHHLEYKNFGCNGESVDYPVYAKKVGHAVADGECEKGILICGTGIGISITANKIKGVMGGRTLGPELAKKIVDIFLNTEFSGDERHVRRIAQIEEE